MKIGKITLFILTLVIVFVSCESDDDDFVLPVQDRAEQQIIDRALLIEYLETHFYNSGDFVNTNSPSIRDIIISELPEDGILPEPNNNTLLIDVVEFKNVLFEEVDYEYYILRLNQGGGDMMPNASDNVRANFVGTLLNGEEFDSSINPIDFDLTQVVPGFSRAFIDFNTAESFVINQDGTADFINSGVGVIFMPSGLGFFQQIAPGIPNLSSLIFKFELFQTEILDHDNDGVPSFLEDLDNDLEVNTDDTDGDQIPNYLDPDDDDDGTLTIDEDINGDGNPLNDDTNGDGVPNYLDTDDTASRNDS